MTGNFTLFFCVCVCKKIPTILSRYTKMQVSAFCYDTTDEPSHFVRGMDLIYREKASRRKAFFSEYVKGNESSRKGPYTSTSLLHSSQQNFLKKQELYHILTPIGLHVLTHMYKSMWMYICTICINTSRSTHRHTHPNSLQSCNGWGSVHLDFKKFSDNYFYGPTTSIWKKYNAVNFQLLTQFPQYAVDQWEYLNKVLTENLHLKWQ